MLRIKGGDAALHEDQGVNEAPFVLDPVTSIGRRNTKKGRVVVYIRAREVVPKRLGGAI